MTFLSKPALLVAALALTAVVTQADVVVIVSAHSTVSNLSNDQVSDLFLGRVAFFPNGANAVPVDQAEGSATRNQFYQKTIGKAAPQMKAYWARMIFTGRGQPPVEAGDDEAVKRTVANHPNLVGYIDKSALDATVKPVLTLH